jgi:hypothetical protein
MSNLGINFTAWPEMLAWPYLILQGWLPYRDIAIAHNPLLLLDLVVFFKIFGLGVLQLKIYTWILIVINMGLMYFVADKFWNKKNAVVTSIFYVLLLIVFEGNGLWFDLALTPFAILLYYFIRQKSYLWSGIIFALGFLTKQTFIYFAIPVVFSLIKEKKDLIKKIEKLTIGLLLVFIPFVLVMQLLGMLDDYYKWAIEFGIFYLPNAVGQVSLPTIKQLLFGATPFLIFVFNPSLLIWSVVGTLGVYPRFEFFHFQPALPFVALVFSGFILSNKSKYLKFVVLLVASIFLSVGIKRQLGNNTRFYESDMQKVSSLITNQYPPITSLYVINYWDNLYALTNTLPPKPLIPYIPWYLNYKDNYEVIVNSLKLKQPEMIVIGEREDKYPEIYEFVDKYYTCNKIEKKVELCGKN